MPCYNLPHMSPRKFFTHLKIKWKIRTTADLVLILIAFSLAGSTEGLIVKPVLHYLGMTETTPLWQKIGMYLLFVLPFYWIFLLVYGFVLGQFDFFWGRLKNLGGLLRKSCVFLLRGIIPSPQRPQSEYVKID